MNVKSGLVLFVWGTLAFNPSMQGYHHELAPEARLGDKITAFEKAIGDAIQKISTTLTEEAKKLISIKNDSGHPVRIKIFYGERDKGFGDHDIGTGVTAGNEGTLSYKPLWLENGETFYWQEKEEGSMYIGFTPYDTNPDKNARRGVANEIYTYTFMSRTPLQASFKKDGSSFKFSYDLGVFARTQRGKSGGWKWCQDICSHNGLRPNNQWDFSGSGFKRFLAGSLGKDNYLIACLCTR